MILVTGATGNVGRELVRALDEKQTRLRVLVREPARAIGFPERVERVVGDLGESASLTRALAGIEKLFLLTPGIGADHTGHAVEAARGAGVRRIVHLSSINVLGDPMPAMGRWHHEREEIIAASGIPATFLRPGGFMTNALEWVSTLRDGGYVLDPIGPGRFAPIDPADVAAVAAAVLTEDGHTGKAYALTGGEVLTVSEQVCILEKAIGRAIEVREATTPAQAVQSRFPNGAPQALIDAIVEGFMRMRADTAGFRTGTVEQILGRKPQTFAGWCARNASRFQ